MPSNAIYTFTLLLRKDTASAEEVYRRRDHDAVDARGQPDLLERIGRGIMGTAERTAKSWPTVSQVPAYNMT